MKWEYKVIKAETLDAFQALLNEHGAQGWEAVFGGYTIGEPKKVTLGQGMAPSIGTGVPVWAATMKRAIKTS